MSEKEIYVFDLGLQPYTPVNQQFRKGIESGGWKPAAAPDGFDDEVEWYSFGALRICVDDTGLGVLIADCVLDKACLEDAKSRLRRIHDRVYRFPGEEEDRFFRRISTATPANPKIVPELLLRLIESECALMLSAIDSGDIPTGLSKTIEKQRARIERFRDSALMNPSKTDMEGIMLMLDHVERRLDGVYLQADRDEWRLENILLFIVSLASVEAVILQDWIPISKNHPLIYTAVGVGVVMFVVFLFLGFRRKK